EGREEQRQPERIPTHPVSPVRGKVPSQGVSAQPGFPLVPPRSQNRRSPPTTTTATAPPPTHHQKCAGSSGPSFMPFSPSVSFGFGKRTGPSPSPISFAMSSTSSESTDHAGGSPSRRIRRSSGTSALPP